MTKGFFFVVFGLVGLFFPRNLTAISQETPSRTAQLSLQAGLLNRLVSPDDTSFFGHFGLDAQFGCIFPSSCDRFWVHILRTHLELNISPPSRFETGKDQASDRKLPFISGVLHGAEIRFTKRLTLIAAGFQIFRETRNFGESFNLLAILGKARVHFGQGSRDHAVHACFLDVSSPGVKYVDYITYDTVPFVGLHVIGISQGCQISVGNQRLAAYMGYSISSQMQVGRSGAENPEMFGPFGVVRSETHARWQLGIQMASPRLMETVGIRMFRVEGFLTAFYHREIGCLYSSASPMGYCGSNISPLPTFFAGIRISVALGFGSRDKTTALTHPLSLDAFSL